MSCMILASLYFNSLQIFPSLRLMGYLLFSVGLLFFLSSAATSAGIRFMMPWSQMWRSSRPKTLSVEKPLPSSANELQPLKAGELHPFRGAAFKGCLFMLLMGLSWVGGWSWRDHQLLSNTQTLTDVLVLQKT